VVVDNARSHGQSMCARSPFHSHSDSALYCSDSALYFRPQGWRDDEDCNYSNSTEMCASSSPTPRNKRKLHLNSRPHLYVCPPLNGDGNNNSAPAADNRWDSILSSPKKLSITATTSIGGLHDIARSTMKSKLSLSALPPTKPSRPAAPPLAGGGGATVSSNDCFASPLSSKLSLSMPRRPRRRLSWEKELGTDMKDEFRGATTAEMISKVLEELNIADDEEEEGEDMMDEDEDLSSCTAVVSPA